jgi:hypothetical protein
MSNIEHTRRDAYFLLRSAMSLIQSPSPNLEDLDTALDLTDRAQEKIAAYRDMRLSEIEDA